MSYILAQRVRVHALRSLACSAIATGALAQATPYSPVKWERFVKVEGQSLPVPVQWLQDEEAHIAHSLNLPDSVPNPQPFDFDKAWWRSWLPGTPKVAHQYFNHLCATEAGEWIFKKVQNVEGLYFARPQGAPTSDTLADPFGLEMPWIQRIFVLQSDSAHDHGTWFIQPPVYNYLYVEQPRRSVKWQAGISEPYVRLYGYTREAIPVPGVFGKAYDRSIWYEYRKKTPMRADGVANPSARYGYTWRGLKRVQDREHGIAGGELLIYDLRTKEVLAVRRQFLITGRNPRGPGAAMWEVAASCRMPGANTVGLEFTQFAFDVLQTIEPSTTGKK
jgi:hypothetical protein